LLPNLDGIDIDQPILGQISIKNILLATPMEPMKIFDEKELIAR